MNINYLKLLIAFVMPIQLFAQLTVTGILSDAKTKQPVEYATVYINGTTRGTISDLNGFFRIENVQPNSEMVISHISYQTYVMKLSDSIRPLIAIPLKPREFVLPDVTVLDKNQRMSNLEHFKSLFLGNDVWGRNATIENEDALHFSKEFITKQISAKNYYSEDLIERYKKTVRIYASEFKWNAGDSMFTYKMTTRFEAFVNEPILVNMPLLGYKVTVNLIHFRWDFSADTNTDQGSILGYFYFQPIPYESKRDSIRIQKNRLKAYYHSPMHLCRSLYSKNMEENGYMLAIKDTQTLFNMVDYYRIPLDSCILIDGEFAKITGLNEKNTKILYFQKESGKPINIKKQKVINTPKQSTIQFLSDTCIIRNDGTMPNNSIQFGAPIGNKRIGSFLPFDYIPTD